MRETLTKSFSNVAYKKAHQPILFIGGDKDNIFPPSLTKACRYKDPKSKVDVKIFANRSHHACGEAGWEAMAYYILDWYAKV